MAETPEVQAFLNDHDPLTLVVIGKNNPTPMSLKEALELESLYCVADDASRLDPATRLDYLTKIISEGSLYLADYEQSLTPKDGE